MSNHPTEVERARDLLHEVVALPGAEARIYQRIMATPTRHSLSGLRVSVVTSAILLSASAALGFGLAPRFVPFSRTVATTAAPKPSPPRHESRGAATKGIESGAETPSPTRVDADGARPTRDGPGIPPPNRSTNSINSPAPVTPVTPTSALSQQVADYREAVGDLDGNPADALLRLRAYRRKWPESPLLHEVDLRVIQVLVSLGRSNEARAAAKSFLEHHPDSARAAEVRQIAASNSDTTADAD
jgi:hypothetical protein